MKPSTAIAILSLTGATSAMFIPSTGSSSVAAAYEFEKSLDVGLDDDNGDSEPRYTVNEFATALSKLLPNDDCQDLGERCGNDKGRCCSGLACQSVRDPDNKTRKRCVRYP